MKFNDMLQWAGTACFIAMYSLMSFFPTLYPWNIVAGMLGSSMYLAWCIRVQNRPQTIVNLTGIAVCLAGLFKAWG